jgi:hypothetical protein
MACGDWHSILPKIFSSELPIVHLVPEKIDETVLVERGIRISPEKRIKN